MTEKEALVKVKKDLDQAEAINNGLVITTIGALRRVYQMAEKQISMRPNNISRSKIFTSGAAGICACGKIVTNLSRYCDQCGQPLDWGEYEIQRNT